MTLIKSKGNGGRLTTLVDDMLGNDFFRMPGFLNFNGEIPGFNLVNLPSVNISEAANDFVIEMAAPGLEKNDFKVEVQDNTLTISSEKENSSEEEKKNYRRQEYSYQSFSRSFSIPDNSIPDKMEAHYENGILKIVLPKKSVSAVKSKKEIKVI